MALEPDDQAKHKRNRDSFHKHGCPKPLWAQAIRGMNGVKDSTHFRLKRWDLRLVKKKCRRASYWGFFGKQCEFAPDIVMKSGYIAAPVDALTITNDAAVN